MFRLETNEWRVNPDQDHSDGPVETRKMTADEVLRYGQASGDRCFNTLARVKYMKPKNPPANTKMTDEQLTVEIAQLGTSDEACQVIAQKYEYDDVRSVQRRIKKIQDSGRLMKDEANL